MSNSAEPSGLAAFPKAGGVPREEIRFGVILNGGVSLAVWMGGSVLELDRLTKQPEVGTQNPLGNAYAHLLTLAGSTARADVIAGTSAGGINGAALALCQVNPCADLRTLRDVWVEQGRIESLLRQPFQGSPTSLLKGDEFFLPRLNDALTRLAVPSLVRTADQAPIDLSITTTVLRANQTVTVDSMGQRLPQAVHAARFHWSRVPAVPTGQTPGGGDPFSDSEIARTAHRLALASRCSASFPVAFEPVFVPVDATGRSPEPEDPSRLTDEQRLRPDMGLFVEDWGDESPQRDRSRYVVDGGLLANTPTRAALSGVEAMAASGPVRRVMLLVYPHAAAPGPDPADVAAESPTVAGTITGLLGALSAQGGRTFVNELEEHNRRAAGRRGTRSDILGWLPEGGLEVLAQTIFEQYRRLREWRAARDLALRATAASAHADERGSGLPESWDYERVRRAAEEAQQAWRTNPNRRAGIPYVPDALPTESSPDPGPRWAWGVSGALGVAEAAADLMRRMIWVLPGASEGAGDSEYETIEAARAVISRTMILLRARRELTDAPWDEDPVLRGLQPNQTYWGLRLASYDRQLLGAVSDSDLEELIGKLATAEAKRVPRVDEEARFRTVRQALSDALIHEARPSGSAGDAVRGDVDAVLDTLLTTLPILRKWGTVVEPAADAPEQTLVELRTWRTALIGDGKVLPDRDRLLTRLLQLEVASTALGDEVTTGATLPVEVVQLSAHTQNASCRYTRSGEDKLGGMSVNRFGGFLKRSWRVNDWTWGRVDAATVLCRIVLQPARVRRTAMLSGYLTDGQQPEARAEATVREVMTHFGDLMKTDSRLQRLRSDAVDELSRVFDPRRAEGDLPAAMPALANLFAWAMHLHIVAEEMPTLAAAIRADRVEGANARSNGEILLQEQATLLALLEAAQRTGTEPALTDLAQALEAFDRAGVGREPLGQEVSSDLTIRTATTAAAVGATVIDSNRSGLRAAKPVTRALRGGMLLPYWVVTALTSRAALARGLALLGLAVGAALLVLALFGALPSGLSGPATALGASAALVAFAYGALRTGTMLHGLVLLTPVIPLLAYAAAQASDPSQGADPQDEHGVSTLLVVVVLAAALMVLGSLPATTGSVWAILDRLAEREGVASGSPASRRSQGLLRWVVGDLLPPLLVLALVLALVWLALEQRTDLVPFLREHWWLGLVALAVLAAGGFAAAKSGSQLQVLRETSTSAGPAWSYETLVHPAGAAAGWSVLYGAGYLAFAAVLVWDPFEWRNTASSQALLITSLVLFVLLVVVLPLLLPLRALREAVRREEERARTVPAFTLPPDDPAGTEPSARDHRALAVDLANRGLAYRWFVSDTSAGGLAPPSLTGRGQMLGKRINKARAPGGKNGAVD